MMLRLWQMLSLCLLLLFACNASIVQAASCPTIRWHQNDDNTAVSEWRICLDYAATQTCAIGHILTIPRSQATPEPTPGDYRACLPDWIRPDQPELYLVACDSAGACSEYSNAWPTRSSTPSSIPTVTGTPLPTWTARSTYTPYPTFTAPPTFTPTLTPTLTSTPSVTPTKFNPPILIDICVAANAQGTPIPCP